MQTLTEEILFEVCENHDLSTVQTAIESGSFDINICDGLNRSLLLIALSRDISEHDAQENLPTYLLGCVLNLKPLIEHICRFANSFCSSLNQPFVLI